MLYWILAKSVDVEAETKVAKTEAEELERLARAHRRPEGHVDNVTGWPVVVVLGQFGRGTTVALPAVPRKDYPRRYENVVDTMARDIPDGTPPIGVDPSK